MGWLRILLGVCVLLAGRELFFVFVGVVGFVFGVDLASVLLAGSPYWVIVIAGVLTGVVFGALAVALQRPAAILVGFLVGGYTVNGILAGFSWDPGMIVWIPFLAGGVVGAVATAVLYDWALIVLSSLLGTSLVVGEATWNPILVAAVYVALSILGIVVQARFRRGRAAGPAAPTI